MGRLGLFVWVLLVAGCRGEGPPIDLVVPAGYTGPVWIGPDGSAPAVPVLRGRYQLVVPPDGVLWVRSLDPLYGRHEFAARCADGSPLRHRFDGAALPPGATAVRGGEAMVSHRGGREYNFIRYFVGTDAEAVAFLEDNSRPLPGQEP